MAGPRRVFWEEAAPDPRGCGSTGATRPGRSEWAAAESALRPQLWVPRLKTRANHQLQILIEYHYMDLVFDEFGYNEQPVQANRFVALKW